MILFWVKPETYPNIIFGGTYTNHFRDWKKLLGLKVWDEPCASVPPYLLPYSANKIADPAPARDLEGFIFARFLSCYSLESQPYPIFLHYV